MTQALFTPKVIDGLLNQALTTPKVISNLQLYPVNCSTTIDEALAAQYPQEQKDKATPSKKRQESLKWGEETYISLSIAIPMSTHFIPCFAIRVLCWGHFLCWFTEFLI